MKQLLKLRLGLVASGVLLGLGGCAPALTTPKLTISITPAVGFAVSDNRIDIARPTVSFRANAGSIGATITGYEATAIDSSGAEVLPDAKIIVSNALSIRVPPGIACELTAAEAECSWLSKGARASVGPASNAFNAPFLHPDAARAYYDEFLAGSGTTGWRVRIVFKGIDDNGNTFTMPRVDPSIQFPLSVQ
jgi:hypothetical protein